MLFPRPEFFLLHPVSAIVPGKKEVRQVSIMLPLGIRNSAKSPLRIKTPHTLRTSNSLLDIFARKTDIGTQMLTVALFVQAKTRNNQ